MRNARNFSLKEKFTGRSETHSVVGGPTARLKDLLQEDTFHTMLTLERRRAERSRKPFVLMLLDAHALFTNGIPEKLLRQLTNAISTSTRETDLVGWYKTWRSGRRDFHRSESQREKLRSPSFCSLKIVKSLHQPSGLAVGIESGRHACFICILKSWTDGAPAADTKLYPGDRPKGFAGSVFRWLRNA